MSRRGFLWTCIGALFGSAAFGLRTLVRAAEPVWAILLRRPAAKHRVGDFSFIHLSDTHLNPRLAGAAYNPHGRSVETLAWIGRMSSKPVQQEAYGVTGPLPAFAIHTGDVFEFSLIDDTWLDFERAIAMFACPIVPVPGNHDNTWGQINRELRPRYGGDCYSFDYGAFHFVCLNSSGFLDPLPCWDRRVLQWLVDDLSRVSASTPVVLAMHHPLSGDGGYASAFDKLRLWEVVRNHHVVLILDGHWHTVHCRRWQGIDRVNGGATFGRHAGYGTVSVLNGVMRVMFHYQQPNPVRQDQRLHIPLLEKDVSPDASWHVGAVTPVVQQRLEVGQDVVCRIDQISEPGIKARAWIDDADTRKSKLAGAGSGLATRIPTDGLHPGWHFATVRIRQEQRPAVDFASEFWLRPPSAAPYRVHEFSGSAGITTRPVVVDDLVLVGDTAGVITALTLDLAPQWTFPTGSQIAHSLATGGDLVVAGDVDGWVHALDVKRGSIRWKRRLANPIYAAAAIVDEIVYLVDGAGVAHALELNTGKQIWSRKVADFAFEVQPLIHGRLLLCGAWDGKLHAVDRHRGNPVWSAWCATCQVDFKTRYYGPADGTPIIAGNDVLVADRGWRVGRFDLDGRFRGVVREQVSAVAASRNSDAFFTRGLDDRLAKYSSAGELLWEVDTPLGRVPSPPVEQHGHVAAVSDTGLFTLVDSASGEKRIAVSISPSLFVLSGIGVDGGRRYFAADMDGRLTCVSVVG